ncbi:hypothetical protein AVEN_144788-1 [Araneus ventricosus]|uniref:Mos1 transposase HTH domain-containing protein n=1 Tax=Araneus ventricosus TaxID=182803 RepID=A0A4Y2LDB2_ARAVE|nr:hypothetical protein AVEN_144788-1 [Araneus ventricosus]
MKEVYREQFLARCNLFRWCQRYEAGRVNIKDLPRPGQAHVVTNSFTISAVDELIRQNCSITSREIAVELSISKGTVHHIIHKSLVMAKFVHRGCPSICQRIGNGENGCLPHLAVSTLKPSLPSYALGLVNPCQWRLFIVVLFHMNCN